MRVNTNMNAMIAHSNMTKNTALSGTSMEKISSGLRITKAADDAAGLAISEKMRSQIRGLEQAGRNVQDGISVVQTAEGAMEEVSNIAQRMRELSVQAANETNKTEDRTKIAEELSQLHDEINRIAESTQFNGKNLLDGDVVLDTRIEKSITANAAIQNLVVEDGFDLSTVTDGTAIKITTAAETGVGSGDQEVTITGLAAGVTATVTTGLAADGMLTAGQEVVLTDAAGKTIKFNVAATQGAVGDVAIGTLADTTINTTGQEMNLQIGANTGDSQKVDVQIQNVSTSSLGLGAKGDKTAIDAIKADGTTGTQAAEALITTLDAALETVNTSRSSLGAMQNRLEYAQNNLTTSSENLTAAESRIRDVDVAKEMMNLSKLNILNQAAQAMMGQAKQQPEGVLQLLR